MQQIRGSHSSLSCSTRRGCGIFPVPPSRTVRPRSLVASQALVTSGAGSGRQLPAVLQPLGKLLGAQAASQISTALESWMSNLSSLAVTQLLRVKVYGDVDIFTLASNQEAIIISANHQSVLDFPVLAASLRTLGIDRVFLVAGDDAPGAKPRHSNWHITVPRVRRKGFQQADVEFIRDVVKQHSGSKVALVVFPERTIAESEGSLRYFKMSPGYLSSKLQVG